MYFSLTKTQELELLSKPETGMGYQVIEAIEGANYIKKQYIVLNAQIAVLRGSDEASDISKIIKFGIIAAKASSNTSHLKDIRVLNKLEFRGFVNEPNITKEKGAIDNPKETANGYETFVRLSAFKDDLRVDQANGSLRPESYTTTESDYLYCKRLPDDPIERYALPNDEKIQWTFYFTPKNTDILQRGIVQQANEKRGGGKEIYFENGTSRGTFVKQTPY